MSSSPDHRAPAPERPSQPGDATGPATRWPPSGLSYAALQRWFLASISDDAPVADSAAAADDGDARAPALASIIRPSRTLAPAARLAIYRDMYFQRLHDVLGQAYPTLAQLCGPAAFNALSRAYVGRYPSRSYTLNDLGRALPHYLTAHADVLDAVPPLAHPASQALLADVARAEWATSEAFDAAIQAPLTGGDIAAVAPERWPEIRFRMHPSVRLLALSHDAVAIINAVKAERALPALVEAPSFAVIWRHELTVWRKALPAAAYAILRHLARGDSLGAAMERAPEHWQGTDEALEQHIFQWFSEWLAEGFFAAMRTP